MKENERKTFSTCNTELCSRTHTFNLNVTREKLLEIDIC